MKPFTVQLNYIYKDSFKNQISDFCCKIQTKFGPVGSKKSEFGPKSENLDLIKGTAYRHLIIWEE